ncbi:hypothetical protein CBS101457_006939 [Exobasidium rhododendri]|nr:hypothetical protein CBS101457_006939 [Exobasidium rhododendri]
MKLRWNGGIHSLGHGGGDVMRFSRPQMQNLLVDLTKHHTPGLTYCHGTVDSLLYHKQDALTISQVCVKAGDESILKIDCDLLLDCSGAARVYRHLIENNDNFRIPKEESYKMNVSYSTTNVPLDKSIVDQMPMPTLQQGANSWRDSCHVMLVSTVFRGTGKFALMSHTDNDSYCLAAMAYDTSMSDMPKCVNSFREHAKHTYFTATGEEAGSWLDETCDLLLQNEKITGQKVKFIKARDEESYMTVPDAKNRHLPKNMALMGDAYGKLNPAFGQGTQKAVTDALTLSTSLSENEGVADVVADFDIKRAPKSYRQFASNRAMDFTAPEIQVLNKEQVAAGVGRAQGKVMFNLMKYMHKYDDVTKMNTLVDVIYGAKGSAAFMHPSILFAVLWGSFLEW